MTMDVIQQMAMDALTTAKALTTTTTAPEPAKAALWCDDCDWCEGDIPPRPWVVRGYLLRGAVMVLSGAGGVSKSSLAVAWGVACVNGCAFGRFRPLERFKVMILNAEDGIYEQRMRLSAALRPLGLPPSSIGGRLIRVGPDTIATLMTQNTKTGETGFTQANSELLSLLEKYRPDVLILDPLVELHNSNENDNTALRQVVAHFRSIAQRFNLAVMVIHHARKPGGDKGKSQAGDQETLRGASAIGGAARIVFTVAGMSAAEAADFGLSKGEERYYLRIDGAKANYSEVAAPEWCMRQGLPLDNGEIVAAVVPWTPPAAGAATPDKIDALLAGIAAGCSAGPYSPRLSGDIRSIRGLFEEHGIGHAAQSKMLRALEKQHGVVAAQFIGSGRKSATGLRTTDGNPSKWPWIDRATPPSVPAAVAVH